MKSIKLYTEGVGLRTIGMSEGVSTPLLIHWIRKWGRIVKQHLLHTELPEHAKDVAVLEIDEFSPFVKKDQKAYVWLAVDRNRNQIIDIIVSKTRDKSVYIEMAERLQEKGYNIHILCTDGYEAYRHYKLAKRHVISKAETSLVESKNSLIRLNLARFNRKIRRFSKAFDMILYSLLLLFHMPSTYSIPI